MVTSRDEYAGNIARYCVKVAEVYIRDERTTKFFASPSES